jgi:4'-phosphopantetheinyl transferase
VELRREVGDLAALAQANFAPDETSAVMVAPPGKRDQAFLEIWTRKEALVKALGGGLSIPLNLFSVALGQPDGNLLKRLDLSGESSSGWCVRSIPDVPHAIAAVALDAPDFELEWLPAEMART